MAVTEIIERIIMDGSWAAVDLDTFTSTYVIALKDTISEEDTIDPADVQKITFELGIDSGLVDPIRPITIGRFTINFNDESSSDAEVNAITAFKLVKNIPTQFYIRPVSISTGDTEDETTGSTSIIINVNALDLMNV